MPMIVLNLSVSRNSILPLVLGHWDIVRLFSGPVAERATYSKISKVLFRAAV
jgi:hypothetical protein